MIKHTLLVPFFFSALPAYAGLTSITAGYDFTDYSGEHGNRNLAYAELVAKVENATLLFNLSQGRRDYETEHFNATRGQGAVWLKWFTEFGHLNRGDMLTSEQHRCHNEKKKFQRRV